MAQITSALPGLEHFDCEGDPVPVGVRWEKWKRALDIYFLAANIDSSGKKRATLLHIGGLALQEVYYNLPGAHVDEIDNVDVYKIAIEKLDGYFSPKQSRYYERYIFRLMKQEEGERFETFLVRLRNQADKCQYAAKDEHLIDQIVEKGQSAELRKKILSAGDSVTLQQVITIATTLETVNRQLDMFDKPGSSKICDTNKSDINKLDTRKFPSTNQSSSKTCFRCGSSKVSAIQLNALRVGIPVNNISTFPKFKDVTIQIPINKEIAPVIQPYRRIPILLEEKVNKKLIELKEADIIEEVNGPSAWVSPMVPVLKENGEVRICIDMRRANEAIIRENHPLPTMDELLPNFRQAKYFSRLDIKNAFHQLEIDESSRYITTFSTSKGLFRYKRLMFGVSCAPEMFQKVLERLLLGCEGTANFIDDIIIYGSDEQEHNRRLNKVLQVLKDNNVLLNEAKCIFKTNRIEFLGHELTAEGIKPLAKYIQAIQSARRPSTVEEIQSFLGLVNYVGKWIPNLASFTEPLRQLVRLKLNKSANIQKFWKSIQDQAFESLKQQLSEIKTLGYYNPADKTQIIADASPVGLGAVLIQIDRKGPRVIAFGNKSLTDCEKRYCQTEKEALALVWAVEHFKIYLLGKEFDLISDHKPLETTFGPRSKPCARIERWVLRLQAYKYKVVYRPGKDNIADAISRLCLSNEPIPFDSENYLNSIIEYSRPVAVPLNEIDSASATDVEITALKNAVFDNKWDESVIAYKPFQTEICFHGNKALRANKLIIPKKLRNRVLEAAHQGHPGIVAMKTRLRTKIWWPKIDRDAENRVKACKGCTLVSAPNPPHPIKRRVLPVEPWIDVAIDFLGPLPSNDYLLVLVDYFSRYKEIKVMKNVTAAGTINALKEIFSRLGYPVTLTCDNGNQFTSENFREFCKECGITINNTIPYFPQMNGEVERQNRDVLKRLRISQLEKKEWKDDLLEYMIMYNSTPHTTTGKTPAELFFRRQFRDKIPIAADIENKITDSEVRDRDKEIKDKGKEYADMKRKAVDSNLEIGEKVYIKNMTKENKLTPNFNPEAHTVTDVYGGDVRVRNDLTGKEYRRNIIHLKRVENNNWKVVDQSENSEMDPEAEN
ncbi:uncharacterized protein K02A2.6-like [Vanessa cardui]|uniref:uncharacterized protein K02A2.6-like n=1 Tax=Vanessa cardui TaxID=171605 RepID=UPI001F129AD0|nr:uncharacterized protein K02A2.6-like [Vanessa cardui]